MVIFRLRAQHVLSYWTMLSIPFVSFEVGEFGYARTAFGNNFDTSRGHLLVGGEAQTFDGPWTNS